MLFVRASVGHSKQKIGHKLHKEDSVNGLLDDLFTLKKKHSETPIRSRTALSPHISCSKCLLQVIARCRKQK